MVVRNNKDKHKTQIFAKLLKRNRNEYAATEAGCRILSKGSSNVEEVCAKFIASLPKDAKPFNEIKPPKQTNRRFPQRISVFPLTTKKQTKINND